MPERSLRKRLVDSILLEIIRIQAFDPVGLHSGDANVVVDHELGEPPAVNQDDFLFDLLT